MIPVVLKPSICRHSIRWINIHKFGFYPYQFFLFSIFHSTHYKNTRLSFLFFPPYFLLWTHLFLIEFHSILFLNNLSFPCPLFFFSSIKFLSQIDYFFWVFSSQIEMPVIFNHCADHILPSLHFNIYFSSWPTILSVISLKRPIFRLFR